MQLTEIEHRPLPEYDLRSPWSTTEPARATPPPLGDALSSVEPGTPRWLDGMLASELGSGFFAEGLDLGSRHRALSERSLQLLSRILFTPATEASPAEPGHETKAVEWTGGLAAPAGPGGSLWSGGLGGSGYSQSIDAAVEPPARADDAAQRNPLFAKLLPILAYLRENRDPILGVIAAVLLLGGYLGSRANRR